MAGSPAGNPPSAPSNVTSITADSSATLSFLAPASLGSGPVTSYTATPYVSGVAGTPTTTAAGSATSITGSNGNTYVQIPCTGLTNSTAYTFTVYASNALGGAGPESAQSGTNTPLSGLVFGDDFNGAASGPLDPEWYVYSRCGFIAQSEVEWYLPSQCVLDGSGNLALTAVHTSHTGPSYPSDGNTVRTQPWISGACQSNVKTWAPSPSTNTMTFEVRTQICANISPMWPGLVWLEGQDFLTQWKTDPAQGAWDTSGKAEIDIQEWNPGAGGSTTTVLNTCFTGGTGFNGSASIGGGDFSAGMHVFQAQWKPGVSVKWFIDGTQKNSFTTAAQIPDSTCRFFLLIYLQVLAGTPTTTQTCLVDYVRVFNQNLG